MNARLSAAMRVLILSGTLAGLPPALRATPLNDEIGNAAPVPVTGWSTTIDLTQATASGGDPACGGPVYQSLWYRYTSPVDQFVQASAQATTGSTAQRPRVSAWAGEIGALAAADCHPDGHEVGFMAQAGRTYWLQVSSPLPAAVTRLNFRVNPLAYVNPYDPVPPKHNLFWYAEPVATLPATWQADVGAGRGDVDYDPPICGTNDSYKLGDTLWYRFTAPADGSVDAMFAPGFDGPALNVWTGTLDQPVFVACDGQGEARPGGTRFQAVAGTTYFIEFGSAYEHLYSLPATLTLRPTPPLVGGSITVEPRVRLSKRVVFVPEVGYRIETHLSTVVHLSCAQAVPSVQVGLVARQAGRSIGGSRSASCATGAADVAFDLVDAKGFTTGPVTLEVTGFDFDAPYKTQATVDGQVVRR